VAAVMVDPPVFRGPCRSTRAFPVWF